MGNDACGGTSHFGVHRNHFGVRTRLPGEGTDDRGGGTRHQCVGPDNRLPLFFHSFLGTVDPREGTHHFGGGTHYFGGGTDHFKIRTRHFGIRTRHWCGGRGGGFVVIFEID